MGPTFGILIDIRMDIVDVYTYKYINYVDMNVDSLFCRWLIMQLLWVSKDSVLGPHTRGQGRSMLSLRL